MLRAVAIIVAVGGLAAWWTGGSDPIPAIAPAAGFALIAALRWGWSGVVAASLGVVVVQAWTFPASEPHLALLPSLSLAIGTAITAGWGASLIRRASVAPELDNPRDLIRFFGLGGVIAPVAGVAVAAVLLRLCGGIPSGDFVSTALSLWFSEAFGCLAFAPLALLVWGEPMEVWKRRRIRVGVPVALAIAVTAGFHSQAAHADAEMMAGRFAEECDRAIWSIESHAQSSCQVVHSIERLFASSREVDAAEFRDFVQEELRKNPGIRALQWVPRVEGVDRDRFEMGALQQWPAIAIRHESGGELRYAPRRGVHFPVTYQQPMLRNERALGFDLASDPICWEAIERARDTGEPTGTALLSLVQDALPDSGFLLMKPVYGHGLTPATVEERRRTFRGLAVGVFLAREFGQEALAAIPTPLVQLRVTDSSNEATIFGWGPDSESSHRPTPLFMRTQPIELFGRNWGLSFAAGPAFEAVHRPLFARAVLLGGLFLAAVLAAFLLIIDGTFAQVESRVKERTAQLALVVEDLKQARGLADQANQLKSDFIANMSHEIRTPLTAVLGFAENLRERDMTPEQQLEATEAIIGNGEHLLQLINDILDISKIEAGKLVAEQIQVDLVDLVRRTSSLIDSKVREKKIDFRVEFITRVPATIQTDPTRVQQMLINLLGNAIKFSPERSTILVTVALSEKETPVGPEPALDFCVFDSGIGMSKDQLSRLFQPFTQAEASTTRRFGGTGLGLTITRQLCEILGGEIVVTSEEGRGTAFRLTIPTGAVDEDAMVDPDVDPVVSVEIPASKAIAKKSEEDAPKRLAARLLLAEDGVDNQKLLRFVLERAGATVEIAEHGGIALAMIREAESKGSPYDLLLTDMQMPEMGGEELVTRLRAEGCTMPIVALTASAMTGDRDRCLELGCDDYSSKPIDRRALIETIESQLERSRAEASDSV